MLICLDCGQTFDESEIHWERDYVGDYGSARAYEKNGYCPYCHGEAMEKHDKTYFEEEEEHE